MSYWNIIKSQAIKFLQSDTRWNSFVQMRQYAIMEVHNKYLIIEKLSGGKPVKLTKTIAESAINKLVKAGRIKKMSLLSSVAREAAVVRLHPSVHWDAKSKEFYWKEESVPTLNTVEAFIEEASDDDLQKVQQKVRRRQNQQKFRKNLLLAYNSKCCISGSSVETVLVAAHIIDHAKSGNNKTVNGLLLRSDLHILFDENLLLIHPDQLTVHLHPSLENSEYYIFHGKQIAAPANGKKPSEEFLHQKWINAHWT